MTDTNFTRIMDGLNEAIRHASGEEVPGMVIHHRAAVTPAPTHQLPYDIPKPAEGWKTDFTADEKALLRPVAETLAMLDGNAFFGMDLGDGRDWYEQYLPEAHELWVSNGRPPLGAPE